MTTQKRPGYNLPVIAAILVLVGVGAAVGGIAYLVMQLRHQTEQMQRVVVPGEGTVTLAEPGTYKIYHEHQSVVGGRSFSNPASLPSLQCTVTAADTGGRVPLRPVSTSETYSMGAHQGVAVWQFDADAAGDYTVSATYPPGESGPEAVLAVGQSMVGAIFLMVFGMMGGCGFAMLMFALALVLVIVWLVRRSAGGAEAKPAA